MANSFRGTKRGNTGCTCDICGHYPAGVHFGAVSCEGCRAFFKRHLDKGATMRCYFGGNCIMQKDLLEGKKDRSKFSRCRACRFNACIKAGMRPDAVRGSVTLERRVHVHDFPSSTPQADFRTRALSNKSDDDFSLLGHDDEGQKESESGAVLGDIIRAAVNETWPQTESVGAFANGLSSFGGEMTLRRSTSDLGPLPISATSLQLGNLSISRDCPVQESADPNDQYLPPFLRKYQDLIRERERFFEETSEKVQQAADLAFGHWMGRLGICEEEQKSFSVIVLNEAVINRERRERMEKFATLLPGYGVFAALRNHHNVEERCSELASAQSSSAHSSDTVIREYAQFGLKKKLYSRYWRDNQSSSSSVIKSVAEVPKTNFFNDVSRLKLSNRERLVALAAVLFRPAVIDSICPDSCTANTVYFMFLNLLEHEIRRRLPAAAAEETLVEVQDFIDRLPIRQVRRQSLQYSAASAGFLAQSVVESSLNYPSLGSYSQGAML